ncbi:Putative membrane protein, conserved [Thermococcus nautili]|uniref:DUF7504 family protein n=1 Tax=Thermococcus nautili TaxID=195522 RepID=UPI002552C0DB|nr:DUF835 domain-containing protein [Thermococcus nautili]CAI1492097.1 Putative membrane protein, conserved [Thermococcus nautili]
MPQVVEIESVMLAVSLVTFGYLFARALRERSPALLSASFGWAFLSFHVFLRVSGYPSLAEAFLYFFALGVSLYVVILVREMYPSKTALFALYLLTPVSHVVYRLMEVMGYPIPKGVGGIASDSGVMLLVTAYIAYRTFKRPLLSLSVVPVAVVFLAYKALRGTLIGFGLMTLGALVFSIATIRVTSSGLFKGGSVPDVEVTGLVLVESRKLKSILDKYSESPILLITRSEGSFPGGWSVFRVSTVPFENSISPTALERLRHIIVQYLVEAKKSGSRGLVVIDCLDFLLLYNDRLAVLKFLGDVRDHAIVNDGVVFVALGESIDEHTRRLLEKLSDGRV